KKRPNRRKDIESAIHMAALLPHSFPQQSIPERFLQSGKPQPGLEAHAWQFVNPLQSVTSEDLFSVHSRGHGGVFPRRKSPSLPASYARFSQSGMEQSEEVHKKDQKPKKPGKYICHYCGRACAKPSVLKKHIRSHTGERPYPCVPCGFSFKTKSNLYKHRKSHAHAIKAGLVPFSELAATRPDMDQASSVGEAEVHSDGDQSTDTDEETALCVEGPGFLDKSSPIPQISFEAEKSTTEKFGELAYADSADELAVAPIQGIQPVGEGPQFAETETSPLSAQGGRVDEPHAVKQKLALRLTEKKGQDSEQSLNLLSPHSKGSTDSGYFSRSESAEQQISPPNTNAKSYEEIMFGKYYRLNPRTSMTVGMTAVVCQDTNVMNIKDKSDHISQLLTNNETLVNPIKLNAKMFPRGDSSESQMVTGCDLKQYPTGTCQGSTGHLETPSDTGTLIRSNSMPTSSASNLNVPQGIRGSHSFDERMTSDDVFYPGSGGLSHRSMLRRQGAFELPPAHEGHVELDSYGNVSKNIVPPSGSVKLGSLMSELKGSGGERNLFECELCGTSYRRWEDWETHKKLECPEMRAKYGRMGMEAYSDLLSQSLLMQHRQSTETATRKRRKEKSVGDDEDLPSQYSSDQGSMEMLVSASDFDSKQANQEASRVTPTDADKLTDTSSRKAVGNVISVIQHTNSLKNIEEVQSPDSAMRAESMDQQQSEGEPATLPTNHQQYHIPPRLVRQPNIQVPEIRVTEEPDKPEKEPEVQTKEPEKHVEEFQWPQRSETLSQLPAEKLPPKKKRLRLAEMEHSSGESSFESTCTSLSRSPSQESNLSHSSSFSMSFDRDETIKAVSPTKLDDFGKQPEFLTVPGSGNSLSIPSQHQQREMRRSSSEQAPCALPTEVPEVRSKSFDYGSLSSTSLQGESYASASGMKERRRGYLVRQASLSVYPESGIQEQCTDHSIKQEYSEHVQSAHHSSHTTWHSSSSPLLHGVPTGDVPRSKRGTQAVLGSHHHPLQLSISEDSQPESHALIQKSSYVPSQHPSESERQTHDLPSREIMQYSSFHSSLAQAPFLPFQQGMFWHPESSQRHKHHLAFQTHQKLHIRHPNLQSFHQKTHPALQLQQVQDQGDAKAVESPSSQNYQYLSRASSHHPGHLPAKIYSTSTVLVQQVQPIFATQNAGTQPSLPGMLVPVRIQTHVPSYGSVMYTSVSQILVTHSQSTSSTMVICKVTDNTAQGSFTNTGTKHGIGFSLSQILGNPGGLLRYPLWKVPQPLPGRLDTGIPLCLTTGSISTTDASSSIGGSKRMLSPASSLELFMETKQQKRVKEEKMYGQIVEELSAVELSNSNVTKGNTKSQKTDHLRHDGTGEYPERMSPSLLDFSSSRAPLLKTSSHSKEAPSVDNFTPPRQIVTKTPDGRESPEELDIDEAVPDISLSPQSVHSMSDTQEENKMAMNVADVQQFFQFPSLRTTTSVSWCFLNYTKPNHTQTTPLSSVYASWCVSSYNPNPPNLNTKTTLSLLRSKQRKNTETYTMAAMYRPGTGKLVSSVSWKQNLDQVKPELMQVEASKFEKKIKGSSTREREKEDHHGEKDGSAKQAEPTRIKIFEGGYKSNEDYVYVRGRGRGKYICEECGIRCKKPSMLKKHIRTHTDVRPYVCKFCNFAFKTKGNLTKHMKSKAHMKKCLELGVSVTSVDDVEAEEADNADDVQRETEKMGVSGATAEHQFSDADDSEGVEEEGDEIDEDDDEDDEYEG
uniref:HIVEP zinc finger 2a n=1 Tax=Lepisosteus oculatus TaxID=7918 RepID=W5LX11_LEPOC